MTDGVHAAVNDVEPPGLEAMANRAPGDTDLQQLLTAYDAVLTGRQRRDLQIPSGLSPYIGLKAQRVRHGPECAR